VAKRYIQTIPNPNRQGPRVGIFYPDTELGREHPDAIEFASKWDVPGQAVYDAINLFKDDATERSTETAAEYERVSCDIDLKDIEDPADKVVDALTKLVYPPSEIRLSGHGIHADWNLKERLSAATEAAAVKAARARLFDFLCADTAINHDAALLRRCGTTNSKDPANPVICRTVAATGYTYDLHDINDLVDECGAHPLFTRKEKTARTNGGATNGKEYDGPINVEEELANIRPGHVNETHCRVIGSMLTAGVPYEEIVERVVPPTILMAQGQGFYTTGDQNGEIWTPDKEYVAVRKCVADLLKGRCREDTALVPAPAWVAPDLAERFEAIALAGGRPLIMWRKDLSWHLRDMGWAWNKEGQHREQAANGKERQDAGTAQQSGRAKILVLKPFVPFDPATLPPREWLYGRHYQRRTVSLTAGPGGMGKSSLVLIECIAMATARNLLGEQPTERLRVWVHNGEDPLVEINRRVAAICQHYSIPLQELAGFLWLTSGTEFPLRVAKGYNNLEINGDLVRQISNAIGENQIDLAAFDPLVCLHSTSEADPVKMDAVIRIFAGIADEHDASIELNHHVRKPAAGIEADIDLHDIRGAMAITDAVRAARVLNRMSRNDAENAGVDEIVRSAHFRVDRCKGNYSPPQAAVWRRFINIPLPNGDDVGVVTPWDFPSQGVQTPEKMAADIRAERVFLQLLDKFTARGVNVSANAGPTHAPSLFSKEKEAKAEKVSKAALKAAMGRLLDAKRIRSEQTGRSDRPSYRLVVAEPREAAA
jgi:RecA-family ATPase